MELCRQQYIKNVYSTAILVASYLVYGSLNARSVVLKQLIFSLGRIWTKYVALSWLFHTR